MDDDALGFVNAMSYSYRGNYSGQMGEFIIMIKTEPILKAKMISNVLARYGTWKYVCVDLLLILWDCLNATEQMFQDLCGLGVIFWFVWLVWFGFE